MGTQINSTDSAFIYNTNRSTVRTSGGTIYQILNVIVGGQTAFIEVWKSANGSSWAEQDHAHAPNSGGAYAGATGAIDSAGIIHIVYRNEASMTPTMRYVQFNTATDLFQNDAQITTLSVSEHGACGVAVDSNDKPHAFWTESITNMGTSFRTLQYSNRISGSWATKVEVYGQASSKTVDFGASMLIDNNNKPQLAFVVSTDGKIRAAIGNANNATSFTLSDCESSTDVLPLPVSIALDSGNNTWISYCRNTTNDQLYLVKHNAADAWTTWQTPVTDSKAVETGAGHGGEGPVQCIAIDGTTIYAIYQRRSDGNIVYQTYTGTWSSVTVLEAVDVDRVNCKWSQYNNNGGTSQIDYCYLTSAVDTTAFWNKISLVASTPLTQTATDDANNLSDALSKTAGIPKTFSDDANNLADARGLGYGNLHTDSFTLSDMAQVVLGYALSASDNANNLADGAVKVVGTITTLADTLATLADANAQLLGYLLALADSEAANWADAHQLLLAQQLALADNSFNAVDAATLNLAQLEPLTDSLPDLADDLAYTLGIQNSFSDSFSLSDSLPFTALGFNFRELADWVVDGPNQTYVILDEDYPVTRAGITFGYNDIGPDDAHHYESVDVRLSGSHQILHAISRRVNFRVFLDPGDYFITLAIGDKNSTVVNGYAEVQDNTTSRFVLSSLTAATGDFVDAAGNVWSEADWPANNVAVRVTIASGILNLKLGVPEDSGRTTISHLAFALADASAQPAPFAIGYGLAIPESITLSDSSALGYGLLVDDSLTLTDACVIQLGQQLTLSDSIDSLDDSSTQQLHEVTAEFQFELDDQLSLDDSTSVQLDHLQSFSDAFSLADNETHTLGYPLTLADDTNSLADSVELQLAQFIATSDSLTFTDSFSLILSYELSTTDALSLADSHTSELSQLAQFADTIILTDASTLRMAHLAQFSDILSLSDDELTVLGYEQNATDSFSLNDAARSELTHLLSFAETVSLSDALSLGIGLALADSAAVFDDSISVQFHHLLDFSESLTFTDNAVIVLGYGEDVADAVSLSDSAGEELGQLLSLADVLTLTDAASLGLGLTLSDAVANLSDSVSLQFEQLLEFDDALNLADSQSSLLGHNAQLSDSLSLSDAETHQLDQQLTFSDSLDVLDDALVATVGETFNFSDTLALADSTQLGYGLVLTDDTNLYMDDILTSAPQGPLREVGVTDALANLGDEVALELGYLLAVVDDAATLDDSISLQEEFRASLSDSLSLTDSLAATLDHLQPLNDAFNLSDAVQLRLGYEIPTSDALVLTDSSTARLSYELSVSDSLVLTDSISLSTELRLALSDAVSLTDAQDVTLSYRASLSDSFTLSDSVQLRLGHELAIVDTISLSDAESTSLTYLLTFTDNVALLADSVTQTTGLALIISDNGPVLTDAISLFSAGQLQLTDALSLTDSLAKFSAGFVEFEDTLVISDSVAFDLRGPDLDEVLSDALQLADVIALSLNNELRLTLQFTDLITLTDHYFDLRFPYTPSAKRHIVVPSRARVTKPVKRAGIVVPPSDRTTKVE